MNSIIISDFSKTITDSSCPTTWSVFAKSGLLGEAYTQERNELYDKYSEYEKSGNCDKTKEWWGKHGDLFVKYGLTRELIEWIVADDQYFKPRSGLKDFLDFVSERDIPLYIVTSWVSNFVDIFFAVRFPDFAERFKTWKLATFGNRLAFDATWKAISFDIQNIITPLNKKEHGFVELIKTSEQIILLWDNTEDRDMAEWAHIISFGFTDGDFWTKSIKLWKNGNFSEIFSKLKNGII